MAGFLDPKQRVMDAILTEIGRLQMMKGEFEVKFVSFSDAGVDYKDAGDGVLEPITERLFFEPFSRAADEIIPEIDGTGKFIIDQEVPAGLVVDNGVLKEESPTGGFVEIDGYSKVTTFTSNTTNRFDSLNILNTISSVAEFDVSPKTFPIIPKPFSGELIDQGPEGIDGLLPLSIDPRFENQLNMRFLPPTYKLNGAPVSLKSFNKWTDTEGNSTNLQNSDALEKRMNEIKETMESSSVMTKITLGPAGTEDYEDYNLLGQVFVKKAQSLKKYLIIDAGEYFNADNEAIARIYFLGFLYKDSIGITKFVREFSIVFHNGDV